MTARNNALVCSVMLTVACAGCSSGQKEDASSQELAAVSNVECSIARGAFVSKSTLSTDGTLAVQCPGAHGIAFNGEAVGQDAASFSIKPHDGVNILHVERGEGEQTSATDIPFLFGTFKDARAIIPNAVVVRVDGSGMSAGSTVTLPLPSSPSALNLSQIASQMLRDHGNVLARFDGTTKDVSRFGFHARVKVIHSSYDNRNVTVLLRPSDRGVHLDVTMSSVSSVIGWEAGALGFDLHDQIEASIGKIRVSADIDLAYDASRKAIRGTLGAHDVHIDNLELDSAALGRVPFGLGDGIEDAISGGAEALINRFADPILSSVQERLVPQVALTVEQFHLPPKLPIPFLGGSVDLTESFDGASFDRRGFQVSLGAAVMAPALPTSLAAPGWLSVPSGAATFEPSRAFGASVSVDYVNQALFAVWKQGLLNRQVSGPVSAFGISTDAIVADAKLPPVVFPHPNGKGLLLNLGEFELTTVFHSTSAGDARVRLAVTLLAGANIQLGEGGETLILTPNGDETTTKVVAELIGVAPEQKGAAAELAGILTTFTPYLESVIAHDLALPPIAVPAVDLGRLSPGFAGKKGRFDGAIRFDAAASRIALEGRLIAQ